jgi:predicted SnoaL-like aldol condensation-catalyzing enzyme
MVPIGSYLHCSICTNVAGHGHKPWRRKMVDERQEANKATVVAFYEKIVNQRDFNGARGYIGSYYKQHRADVADGPEGLRDFIERSKRINPDLHADIKRVLADCDFVVLHSHVTRSRDDRGSKHVDIFRLEDGKLVEHWDIDQPIAEASVNSNGPF